MFSLDSGEIKWTAFVYNISLAPRRKTSAL